MARGTGSCVPVPEIMVIIVSGIGVLMDVTRQFDATRTTFHGELINHRMADVPQAPSIG